jgi:hypothetical protein
VNAVGNHEGEWGRAALVPVNSDACPGWLTNHFQAHVIVALSGGGRCHKCHPRWKRNLSRVSSGEQPPAATGRNRADGSDNSQSDPLHQTATGLPRLVPARTPFSDAAAICTMLDLDREEQQVHVSSTSHGVPADNKLTQVGSSLIYVPCQQRAANRA